MSVADLPGQRNSKGSLKPTRREELHQLRAENERLRALLGMDEGLDEESWAASAPQDTRDQVAAAAYSAEALHPFRALQRIGFRFDFSLPEDKKRAIELARRIFETEGVRAILHSDAEKFSANKEAVMRNLYNISISPIAKETDKVRAAGQLAKMIEGWQDGEKVKNPANVFNFLTALMDNKMPGASINGSARVEPLELPPGGDTVIDAEEFFVERDAEVAVVVDDAQETRRTTR